MALQTIYTSSKSSEWETPKYLFNYFNKIYNFDIDVCATDDNALINKYWTKNDNCLIQSWCSMVCWMNPPYGREISLFMEKAYNEYIKGAIIVCLIPSRTDTKWWHEYVMKGNILFIKGRLKFINRTFPSWREDGNFKVSPAGFPSAIVIFDRFFNERNIKNNDIFQLYNK